MEATASGRLPMRMATRVACPTPLAMSPAAITPGLAAARSA